MSLAWTLGAHYTLESEAQFDAELDDILDNADPEAGLDSLDLAFKSYIAFAADFYDQYLQLDTELERCTNRLLRSSLFADYRDRMVNLAIDIAATALDPPTVHIALTLLLKKAKTMSHIFRWLRKPRPTSPHAPSVLVVCLKLVEKFGVESIGTEADSAATPHAAQERLGVTATVVLYEVCRSTKFDHSELALLTETFIGHLFRLVESTRDGDELFNYSVVRLIISINEQFMVASVDASHDSPVPGSPHHSHKKRKSEPIQTNRVLKTLSEMLGALKTFGENLIFILNRLDSSPESLCVALLILKMLYLLFSTPATFEYFYTNDLCVLVDVFIRQLSDLPDESEGLRHTYLRVLHPLLTNTQLREHPYKRHEIRRVLHALIADDAIREVNATTKRLAERNLRAEWCTELERSGLPLSVAAKKAGTGLASLVRPGHDLPVIDRTASRSSVASTSSDASGGPLSASSTSTFGGRFVAEPMMTSSTLSVADVARTLPSGMRRPMSSSSDLGAAARQASIDSNPSRTHSPAPSFTDDLLPPRRVSSMAADASFLSPPHSPPPRPSSAAGSPLVHASPGRRPPPPLPEGAAARRRVLGAVLTGSSTRKARRPPPERPVKRQGGLAIDNLSLS